ncbi:MAG TPA: hypothetical protein VNS34_27020 [Rhizobiaceae bacterium]|nr:hypothetical protein [Rhizobiaceae bacterium]
MTNAELLALHERNEAAIKRSLKAMPPVRIFNPDFEAGQRDWVFCLLGALCASGVPIEDARELAVDIAYEATNRSVKISAGRRGMHEGRRDIHAIVPPNPDAANRGRRDRPDGPVSCRKARTLEWDSLLPQEVRVCAYRLLMVAVEQLVECPQERNGPHVCGSTLRDLNTCAANLRV